MFQISAVASSDVKLDVEKSKKKKQPRRLIHCSDGILEEYSTDEEERQPLPPSIDPVRFQLALKSQGSFSLLLGLFYQALA